MKTQVAMGARQASARLLPDDPAGPEAVAVLMLMEEGKLRLSDPISKSPADLAAAVRERNRSKIGRMARLKGAVEAVTPRTALALPAE